MARVGRWTTWALETAMEAVVDGASYDTAAALSGVPRSTIREHALRRGLATGRGPGRRRVAKAKLDTALRAVAGGATHAQAVEAAGISLSPLRRALGDEGVVVARERKRRPSSFTLTEREEIRVGIRAGESDAAMAERLGRHRCSVWREIRANGGRHCYRAAAADERAGEVARRPKTPWIEGRPWLWEEVQDLLRTKKWSPEQIARRLGRDHPDQPEWWVSHEAIYQAIFVQAKGELRKELAACLRSGRARRRPRTRTSSGQGQIAGMINISDRPAEVEDRAVPGHWEGDLIVGANGASAVASASRGDRDIS